MCRRSQESKSHRIQTSTVFSRSKLFELWKLPGCQVEDRPVSCQVETRLMPTRRRSRQIQQACVERVNTSAKSARKPKQQEACRIQKTDQNGCHPGAISGYNPPKWIVKWGFQPVPASIFGSVGADVPVGSSIFRIR